MIIDFKIREKWHEGFERDADPTEIIIHGTGGGGTYKWVLDGGRKKLYKRGIALFHYLIERDGGVTEIIDPDRWVYHSSSGRHDRKTIGIELLNPEFDNTGHYTTRQYKALFDLMFDNLFRYPIKIIRSHNVTKQIYSGKPKKCPGTAFDWWILENEMITREIDYKMIWKESYLIEV